jgi:hypothetical protein
MDYGRCPTCGGVGRARERRPNGDTICVNGHKHSSQAFQRHAESARQRRAEVEGALRDAAARQDVHEFVSLPAWVVRWILYTYFPKD